ncbi:MAG: peptidase S13, partial [Pedobacter sp.]
MFHSRYVKYQLPLLIALICLFLGCSADRVLSRKVASAFKNSELIKQYQVGFALYNSESEKMVFSHDASKQFTPASNTKLFTFYAALKMIPDSMPSLRYIEKNDSLIFWGTGDPSFLQSVLKDKTAYNFLLAGNKKLFFAPGRYTGNFFGAGWAWDDYNDYYQAEINDLPLLDNTVWVKGNARGGFSVTPKNFSACFIKDSTKTTGDFFIKRKFNTNEFDYNAVTVKSDYTQQIPFKVSPATTVGLLADTLHKSVELINMKMPSNAKTLYGTSRDSVLKAMLLPSDNFIAEQLLLVCGNKISDTLNTEKTIQYVLKNYLADLPQKPRWIDGSGLSRMNLLSPDDMIAVLNLISKEVNNQAKLFDMLP